MNTYEQWTMNEMEKFRTSIAKAFEIPGLYRLVPGNLII
jgi:hypothetical protein